MKIAPLRSANEYLRKDHLRQLNLNSNYWMKLSDAIALLKGGVPYSTSAQVWYDLGAGQGLFTQALSSLLPAQSLIYAVDLKKQRTHEHLIANDVTVRQVRADFTAYQPPQLADGIVMANALHFVKDKGALLEKLFNVLLPAGVLVIVEYEMSTPTPWVPFPINFDALQELIRSSCFKTINKLHHASSRYVKGGMYSAVLNGAGARKEK